MIRKKAEISIIALLCERMAQRRRWEKFSVKINNPVAMASHTTYDEVCESVPLYLYFVNNLQNLIPNEFYTNKKFELINFNEVINLIIN